MKNKKLLILSIISVIIIICITIIIIENHKNDNHKNSKDIREEVMTEELKKYFDSLPENNYGHINIENTENVVINNNEKTNISPKIKETHTFEEYEISNMKIFTIKDTCFIVFDIKNINYTGNDPQIIDIIFKDKEGNNIDSANYILDIDLVKGKKKRMIKQHVVDHSNAYDYDLNVAFK